MKRRSVAEDRKETRRHERLPSAQEERTDGANGQMEQTAEQRSKGLIDLRKQTGLFLRGSSSDWTDIGPCGLAENGRRGRWVLSMGRGKCGPGWPAFDQSKAFSVTPTPLAIDQILSSRACASMAPASIRTGPLK